MKGMMKIEAQMDFEILAREGETISEEDVMNIVNLNLKELDTKKDELKVYFERINDEADWAEVTIEYNAKVKYTYFERTYYDPEEFEMDGVYEDEWQMAFDSLYYDLRDDYEVERKNATYEMNDGRYDYEEW